MEFPEKFIEDEAADAAYNADIQQALAEESFAQQQAEAEQAALLEAEAAQAEADAITNETGYVEAQLAAINDDAEMQDLRDAQAAIGVVQKQDFEPDALIMEPLSAPRTFRVASQTLIPELEEEPYVYENDDTAFRRGRDIESKTVILDISISGLSFTVKANPNDVIKQKEAPLIAAAEEAEGQEPGEVDTKYLRMSKRTIPRDALRDIGALDSQIKNFLKARSVPCRMLRGGMLLIPTLLVSDVDKELQRYKEQRAEIVGKFIREYDALKREARESLGTLYNEGDYPTIGAIRSRFTTSHRWLSFNISAALKNVSSEIFAREQQKLQAEFESASGDIQIALREAMQDLVTHLFDQLKPSEDGKKKQLRSESIEKLETFLNTFSARNLTDDKELEALANQARAVITGVDVKALRKDGEFRSSLMANLEQVKSGLDAMVTTRTRKIIVEDE